LFIWYNGVRGAAMEWDLLETLQAVLTNPNVAYVLLVLGLWAIAAAWAIPGTGFPEAVAVICLVLATLGLARLPVSFVGLAMVLVSMVLFAIDLKVQSVGLTLGAATAFALGSLFLFRSEAGVLVSRWLVGGVTLVSLVLFSWVLSSALRAQALEVRMDPRSIVGARGVAVSDLDPRGIVRVESELWTAEADGPVPAGTQVQVLDVEGVLLQVLPVEPAGEQREA
jgi:membrane-bound serine protease (ClpP class)